MVEYTVMNDYAILTDGKGRKCIIDTEDLEKILKFKSIWANNEGYWKIADETKMYLMHRYLLNVTDSSILVDHIAPVKQNFVDNRKSNLRLCNHAENSFHKSKGKNNTSGIIGVRPHKTKWGVYWRAEIKINGKNVTLCDSKDKERAVIARLKAEKEYFGEFAPQKDMFEKYGI